MNDWETLHATDEVRIRRRGRFVVADLLVPHRVLSTSVRTGGQSEAVRHLVNHQCCEGAGHDERFRLITENGQDAYHDIVAAEVGLPPEAAAILSTAASMNNLAVVSESDGPLTVTAAVTAGVQTNAICAGDPATWREGRQGMEKAAPVHGTINTILLVNTPMTPGTLARAVAVATEGKSAALQRLAAPSCNSADLATGTGTDQYALAAPVEGAFTLTSASPHLKLGELIGLASRKATLEALRWQNGLEPSYTRSLFHALGRYGLQEATFLDDVGPRLAAADLELLRRNLKAALYEPLVGAAAHAMAAVLDRVRHGTLPSSVARDALVQQAATLAVGLAARPDRWPAYRQALHAGATGDPKTLVLDAVALGWREKWRTS